MFEHSAGVAPMVTAESMVWLDPSRSMRWAPASRAMTTPAAVSQGLFDKMMIASSRPEASQRDAPGRATTSTRAAANPEAKW